MSKSLVAAFADQRHFIIYRASDKTPIDPLHADPASPAANSNAQDPATHLILPYAAAYAESLGAGYGIGIVLGGNGLFCIDLDGCLSADGILSPTAQAIVQQYRKLGAYVEQSMSGRGVHIIGSTAVAPPHRCKNIDLRMELYTAGRYIALTGNPLQGEELGDTRADCTAALCATALESFPPKASDGPAAEWTTAPLWHVPGTADDEKLLEKAKRSKSARAMFGDGASFKDLWDRNIDKLSKEFPSAPNSKSGLPYDGSSVDQSLANRLMWWAGGDCARVLDLMRREDCGLKREKYERLDYMEATILRALAWVAKNPPTDRTAPASVPPPPPVTAVPPPPRPPLPSTVTADDFRAYLPEHKYIFIPTGDLWPAASVDKKLPQIMAEKPSVWLDMHRSIEQMTWAPGDPQLILNTVIADGGRIPREGCTVFNLYKAPLPLEAGPVTEKDVAPWLDLLNRIYPEHAEHYLNWFAHRIQRPGEKINHALVMGGKPGIGKDSLLAPVARGVGVWNFREASPSQLLGRFNGFLKSVILRISEARDQGDGGGAKVDRYGFYEHTKTLAAAPPDTLLCDEKNIRAYPILNVTGLIITTNHKTDGIYLPPDDRRHYVTWSNVTQQDFPEDYFRDIHSWYARGGLDLVARYLKARDLSGFDPKATPVKTAAFWAIVDANKPAEDSELADALDKLGRPAAVTVDLLIPHAVSALQLWLRDRKNSRNVGHRFETAGYEPVRCEQREDGKWRVGGERRVIYGRADLNPRDRYAAAKALSDAPPPPTPGH